SHGVGFGVPVAAAVILGLAPQTNGGGIEVTLNANLAWTFGQDAVGAILHEITEGGFGRIGSLGIQQARWALLDLFRFTADGERDYTGGADGLRTFFGVDGAHLSPLTYHNAISADGTDDGGDLGDWALVRGDAFGGGGPGSPGVASDTDLQVLDVLGWTPAGATPPPAPPDDFANSLADRSHPIGQLAAGGSATGALQAAGDRDWFSVQLNAGVSYTISLTGRLGGGGDLADPFLRLHDSAGATLASNDDIVNGTNPDSRLVFVAPATGTYYVEAGGFLDGYIGTYSLAVVPADDFANNLAAGNFGTAAVGAAATGLVEVAGDRDWFRVQLTAGSDYALSLQGQGSGGGSLANPSLVLHDAGGATLAADGDSAISTTLDSRLVFHAVTTGTYYVEAGASLDQGTGSYTLRVATGAAATATAGNDLLAGDATPTSILAGAGADTIMGGDAANYLRGDEGNDSIQGGSGFDDINGNMGDDTAHGGAGDDWVVGGKDNDALFGDAGNDIVYGNIGADTCDGGNGADLIRGGQDNDLLTGGAGDDWLSGDRGADTITGGTGADIFHTFGVAGADVVTDFNAAEGDRVQLDPGTIYHLDQSGPNVVINMVGLGYMVLENVQLSSLPPGWIFTA
ncbi:MAG: pre-peptidase C-terminal domain-containing protein, partial [Phenylobacterium sp.]